MELNGRRVKGIAWVYVMLPLLLFLFFWLRPVYGVPLAGFLIYSVWHDLKAGGERVPGVFPTKGTEFPRVTMSGGWALVLVAIIVAVCVLAGQGGFVPQADDWNWRNAVFRDLINHSWPVRYRGGEQALVFYVGHWLPAAMVGKCVRAVSGNEILCWRIANLALMSWTVVGVTLAYALMLVVFRLRGNVFQLSLLCLFLGFGGLDIVGWNIVNLHNWLRTGILGDFWIRHYQWAGVYQFTPAVSCLYWVFHQTVVPWVIVLLLVADGRVPLIGCLTACCLICAPFPACGVMIIVTVVLGWMAVCAVRAGRMQHYLISLFSQSNVISVLLVGPVVACYLFANPQSGSVSIHLACNLSFGALGRYLFFVGISVGAYWVLTFCWARRNIWWWATLMCLMVTPLIKIGGGVDFCMRASIPAMLLLSCFVAYDICCRKRPVGGRMVLLIGCLLLGCVGGLANVLLFAEKLRNRGLGTEEDRIVSFERDLSGMGRYGVTANCVTENPDCHWFFKVLASRP